MQWWGPMVSRLTSPSLTLLFSEEHGALKMCFRGLKPGTLNYLRIQDFLRKDFKAIWV